jgi:tetratricopeptide (TPR) repeat protein
MHHVSNGMAFLDMGLLDDAFREFDAALEEDPVFSPAYAGKGIYWSMMGLVDVSQGYISLASAYAENSREEVFALVASMQRELLLKQDGWFEEVSQTFDRIIEMSPENGAAYYWMGVGLVEIGDIDDAGEKLKRAAGLAGMYRAKSEQLLMDLNIEN